jgi:cytochrome b involved in lipid metabolism
MAQVAAANGASKCWTVINGNVYDLTTWINQHPGGPEHILSICGKDGTSAFEAQHGGQSQPASILASFKIGTLAQ